MKKVYAITRVDVERFHFLQTELDKAGLGHIKAIVPSVPILISTRRGKKEYKEVPILFNYGFLRVPLEDLYNREFLLQVPKVVPSMYSWVTSPEPLHRKKIRHRTENYDLWDDFSQVAIASDIDVKRFIKLAESQQVYGADDILTLPLGSYITLKGYPYEGLGATILEVNPHKKQVKVQVCEDFAELSVWVDFGHVLYSPYYPESPLPHIGLEE